MRKPLALATTIAASLALLLSAAPASATTTIYRVTNGTIGAAPVLTVVSQTCADTTAPPGADIMHLCVQLAYYNKVRSAGSSDSLAARFIWNCAQQASGLPESCSSMSSGISLKLDAPGTNNPLLLSWTSHCDTASACRDQACDDDPVYCAHSASAWHQTDYYGPFNTDTGGGGSHVCPKVTPNPAFVLADNVMVNGTSVSTTARSGGANFVDCYSG